jgi:hypothetical protein
MRFDQGELAFSNEDHPWLRREKEPARAYRAFELYRDQGPCRTVAEALREYRAQNSVQRREDNRVTSGVPAAWRRWRKDWAWDERLQAFDKHRALLEATIEAEAEGARMNAKVHRRREHDEIRYRRLIHLSSRLDSLLNRDRALLKTRNVKKMVEGVQIEEQDSVREFTALSEEEHRIAEEYFGAPSKPESSGPQIPQVAKFVWVPDPEVPPAPSSEPTECRTSDDTCATNS